MICIQLQAVLLITPDDDSVGGFTGSESPSWMQIQPGGIGDTLRMVRHHRPEVLVFDLSKQQTDGDLFAQLLDMIVAVRARLPRLKITALGCETQPSMERIVRQQGVTAYVPVSPNESTNEACRVVQALYAHDAPARAHSPPRSGAPPGG